MSHSAQPTPHTAAQLYEAHHPWLLEWLRRRLHHIQWRLFRLWVRAGRQTEPIHEPRAFLTTLAQRTLYTFWRRRELERAYLDSLESLPQACAPSEEQRALVVEALMQIDRALQRLPARTRQIFLLSQLHELTYPQIAEQLGVSAITVRRGMKQAITLCVAARLAA